MTGPRPTTEPPPARCLRGAAAAALAAALLAACGTVAPPPTATNSIAALYLQPAERSLVDGIRLYEDASFERAEAALRQALAEGLADGRDRAAAHKYIAFIACAFDRLAECEANFASAFAADPGFTLDDREIGHPVWGPVYRQVAAARPR